MLNLIGIDHVVLRTTNSQKLIKFYCDVLGCRLERDLGPEYQMQQLRAGNSLIDIVDVNGKLGIQGGPAPTQLGNNLDHFCLRISAGDPQEVLDHLNIKGAEHMGVETRYGAEGFGPSIYLRDPDGNLVELKLSSN